MPSQCLKLLFNRSRPRRSLRSAASIHVACCALVSALFFSLGVPADSSSAATGPDSAARTLIEQHGLRESNRAVRDTPGWRKPEKIVVLAYLNPEQMADLQSVAPGVELVAVSSQQEAQDAIKGAQALLGMCNAELLSAADQLHWVQVFSAGVENCIELQQMQTGKYVLTNGQRIGSPALAEASIALMMMLTRGLDLYYQNQLQSKWQRDVGAPPGTFMELEGRTMLVVGLGGIGTQVAKRAHGLGMRVIATRGSSREGPDYVEYVGLADEVNELAKQADVVVNTVPLTDETTGMFDRVFFDAMKPTAFFISVGRGASTVTEDLMAALQSQSIAGAGLDVTDPEPLPADHPLWKMPRVVITPHTAGLSDGSRQRLGVLVKENLRRYVAGEPLLSEVDVQRGY